MCFDKITLDESTKANHKYFDVLPINLLYKKIAITFNVKKISLNNNIF